MACTCMHASVQAPQLEVLTLMEAHSNEVHLGSSYQWLPVCMLLVTHKSTELHTYLQINNEVGATTYWPFQTEGLCQLQHRLCCS